MTMKGCANGMKWTLVAFNALVLCAGAIAIGLGAWGMASEYGAEKLKDLTGSELFRGAAIAIIVGGSVMVAISIIGIIGAVLENRIMLGVYVVIVLLLVILFVVAASVGYAYRDILGDKLTAQMEVSLINQYGVDVDNNNNNNDVTHVWDELQKNLMCCGVKGRTPGSQKSWFLWQSSMWFNSTKNKPKKFVPETCCNIKYNTSLCVNINKDPTKPVQMSNTMVIHESEYIYNRGCYDQLQDFVKDHIIAIAGIAIAIIIVMFLCCLFAVCVCANIRKKNMAV